jgi:TetR/AcrR family transcriptional regulator, cholesterol catabolism regulator
MAAAPPARPVVRAKYDQRREYVVSVAAREFAKNGYHATSIEDLVLATGLQRGGLYHYIDSKQQLLWLIHDQLLAPLLVKARVICEDDAPPAEQLDRLMHVWVSHVAEHRDHMVVFNEERRLIETGHEWEAAKKQRNEFQDLLYGILQRGIADGSFSLSDPHIALMSILGIVNHMSQWFHTGGRLSAEKIAARCVDLVLHGIAAPDRASRETATA